MTNEINVHFNISYYQKSLLTWYQKYGRHNLPWQGDFSPYHVWLSEIMLQQTQVKTVIPYFLKFIEVFPDIITLANEQQDKVMQYWAGLGYYARARNLHKAAQIMRDFHQGKLPHDVDTLMALPGIGRSTAHAILSIAFSKPTPILDGNVKRVFARLFQLGVHPNDKSMERYLWQLANKLMPIENTQAYTQVQMDFGAALCTRTRPKCIQCPLNDMCLAYNNQVVKNYPVKKPQKVKPVRSKRFYLYCYQDELLLIKKPNKGIWGGLYVLPDEDLYLGEYTHMLCQDQRHIFTHFELNYDIKVHAVNEKTCINHQGIWVHKNAIKQYALPAPLARHLIISDQKGYDEC
ncbi:A/G-specific adenine glycosylase [Fastidiosibacter lacustris]|uniref:A/G-specific adenine glycosylase n=1 Tax=Fastidiosibacter lacustris TaxID=2056695 RepID=UPI0013007D72|nr:A/G-specific adenine glycosylase [Fastidiosibacter lacustris]